jgi:hypothetical protein
MPDAEIQFEALSCLLSIRVQYQTESTTAALYSAWHATAGHRLPEPIRTRSHTYPSRPWWRICFA